MSHKGTFTPRNPHKYVGNAKAIVYRSTWELSFMRECDSNDRVIQWMSEEFVVPYFFPGDRRWHRYYPDFVLTKVNVAGEKQTYMIEIKPDKQTRLPVQNVRAKTNRKFMREALEYAKNQCKWKAAEALCAKKGWIFKVVTEKELYPKI